MRITGLVIFCIISTLIVILRIAELENDSGNWTVNSFNDAQTYQITPYHNSLSQDVYVPPNYGAPDSQYGSGTR